MKEFEELVFKKTKKSRVKVGIALLLLGIALTLIGGRIFIGYTFASKDLADCNQDTIKNGYYKFNDVYELLGEYGYDNKGSGYVLILRDKTNPQELILMGMYFAKKDVDIAEKVSKAYWDSYDSGSNQFVYISGAGRVRDMKSDEKKVFREALFELDSDASSRSYLEDRMVYKTIEYKTFPRMMKVTDWVMVLSGIFLIGFSVYLFITASGGKSRKQVLENVAVSGMDPGIIANELKTAKRFGNVLVADDFVLFEGFTPRIFFYKYLVWVYGKVTNTQHKAYGIINTGTTTTYQISFLDVNKKNIMVPLSKGNMDDIITAMHENAPYVIFGYNEGLANEAKNNFNSVLNAVRRRKAELEEERNAAAANAVPWGQQAPSMAAGGEYGSAADNQQADYSGYQNSAQQPDYSGYQSSAQQPDYSGYQNSAQQADYSGYQDSAQQPDYSGYQNSAQQPDYSGYQNDAQTGDYTGNENGASSYGGEEGEDRGYSDQGFGNTADYGNVNDYNNF